MCQEASAAAAAEVVVISVVAAGEIEEAAEASNDRLTAAVETEEEAAAEISAAAAAEALEMEMMAQNGSVLIDRVKKFPIFMPPLISQQNEEENRKLKKMRFFFKVYQLHYLKLESVNKISYYRCLFSLLSNLATF